jgi:hypothetical protein
MQKIIKCNFIDKLIYFQKGGDASLEVKNKGYYWWYIDGLFPSKDGIIAISFHISNKSMMSFSRKINPAYKLTIAKISNLENVNSVEIITNKKQILKENFQASENEITFKDGYIKNSDNKFVLSLNDPELKLSIPLEYPNYLSPKALFFNRIYLQQIQYAAGNKAELNKLIINQLNIKRNAIGTGYIENVFGNAPCFFALKEWMWLRADLGDANIVIAIAKTNLFCAFKQISMLHLHHKNGQSFSSQNTIEINNYKDIVINIPDLKIKLTINKFFKFQDYSPYKRLNSFFGRILDKLFSGRCIRCAISLDGTMELKGKKYNFNNKLGMFEIRSFYGYDASLYR